MSNSVNSAPAASATPAVTPASTPSQAQATPASPAQQARMMTLKVDGQEMQLSESEVIALAQQGKSANKKFQEAATTRKQAEEIIQFAKTNPKEFFAKTGMNAREWAENYLLEQIQHDQMSPEQRTAKENEGKLKKYEAQEKANKAAAQQKEVQEMQDKYQKEFDVKFVAALTESGLPRTAYTVSRMAQLEMVNLKKGLNLNASQLASIVREDYVNEQKALFTNLDGDALINFLGKDAVKKLSKAQLAQYKGAAKTQSAGNQSPRKESKPQADAWKELKKKNRMPY